MDITIKPEQVIFHPEKVAQAIHDKAARALEASGKYLYKAVIHSIRKSDYPAKPGKPPHTRENQRSLRKAVRWELDKERLILSLGIAPTLGNEGKISNIASTHEYGGKARTRGGARPYHLDDVGPIRLKAILSPKQRTKDGAIYDAHYLAVLTSPAMVHRANALAHRFHGRQLRKTATYPERPFLAPSLEKAIPYIQKKFGI